MAPVSVLILIAISLVEQGKQAHSLFMSIEISGIAISLEIKGYTHTLINASFCSFEG